MSRDYWETGDGKRLKRVIEEGGILATVAGEGLVVEEWGWKKGVCWRFERGPYGFFTLKCKHTFVTK